MCIVLGVVHGGVRAGCLLVVRSCGVLGYIGRVGFFGIAGIAGRVAARRRFVDAVGRGVHVRRGGWAGRVCDR